MINAFVYDVLANDATLRALIGASAENSRIDPRETKEAPPALVYKCVPGSYSGLLHRDRIEIRIIDVDDENLIAVRERIDELLIKDEYAGPVTRRYADGTKVTLFACTRNGGGEMQDERAAHRLLYYDTVWR